MKQCLCVLLMASRVGVEGIDGLGLRARHSDPNSHETWTRSRARIMQIEFIEGENRRLEGENRNLKDTAACLYTITLQRPSTLTI